MIVVRSPVAHEPVHGVDGRDGIKVLLGFRKLHFKSRHFYIVLRWLGQLRFQRRRAVRALVDRVDRVRRRRRVPPCFAFAFSSAFLRFAIRASSSAFVGTLRIFPTRLW